jgi:hypothetical protein
MRKMKCIIFVIAWAVVFIPGLAGAGISIEGGLTNEKVSKAGETYQGEIVIKNQEDTPQELKIYQSDYRFNCEGETTYGEPGKDARSNARWISFSPSKLTIPPKETATINYTITVPGDQALVGTFWSMLMIEGLPTGSPESAGAPKEKKLSLGITQIMRYAVQVVTHIGDTGTRKVKFIQTKILKEKDARILQVDVQNDGERLLHPQLWTELYAPDGTSMGRFEGEQYRVYPGTSKRFRIDISKLPAGTYKALVVADCGENDLIGIQYTLKFEN